MCRIPGSGGRIAREVVRVANATQGDHAFPARPAAGNLIPKIKFFFEILIYFSCTTEAMLLNKRKPRLLSKGSDAAEGRFTGACPCFTRLACVLSAALSSCHCLHSSIEGSY